MGREKEWEIFEPQGKRQNNKEKNFAREKNGGGRNADETEELLEVSGEETLGQLLVHNKHYNSYEMQHNYKIIIRHKEHYLSLIWGFGSNTYFPM